MPTYEYKCDACGYAFERFQPITADPVKRCPECGKAKVKRLISAGAGIIFKGSGFYITDYRSEGYNNSAKADKAEGGTSGEAKTDTKSESKSDSKSDSKPAADVKPAESKAEAKAAAAPAPPKPAPQASKSAKKSK